MKDKYETLACPYLLPILHILSCHHPCSCLHLVWQASLQVCYTAGEAKAKWQHGEVNEQKVQNLSFPIYITLIFNFKSPKDESFNADYYIVIDW